LGWNLYGSGIEQIGRQGSPENFPLPEPGDDQLLVRVDALSLCFSDVKLIQQGSRHPKLYGRDLAKEPTRLGHEAVLTVVRVGGDLRQRFRAGQRFAVQPDIYQNGRSTAYGYTIPGGLIQFHLIGAEVLNADHGCYLLPVGDELGYAEAALTEPWACVEGAYRQRRRLEPAPTGMMWIVGRRDDATEYRFSKGLGAPRTIVLTDVAAPLRALVQRMTTGTIIERNGIAPAEYSSLSAELTGGKGFDDIVMLDPRSADAVTEAAKLIARRGTLNLVGRTPLDGKPQIDFGRIHYDYTAFVGTRGPDIAASYGDGNNRSELKPGGVAAYIGAGGPMGQMHIQRAIELTDGPRLLIATDVNEERLAVLRTRFQPLAAQRGKHLTTINPQQPGVQLPEAVREATDGGAVDDVIVCVPSAAVMAEATALMAPDGMLVLFAGVPNGTFAPLDLSNVYLHGAQFTGTSGSTLDDQATVIRKATGGELSPNRSVAAIGSIEAAQDGVRAMMEGRYPGKVVIFPQLRGLPLTGVAELKRKLPNVAAKLGPGDLWTREAEQTLIEQFWRR
jgi:threonine dehydrogenase-like Zn-dependent dehydrogenase